MKEPNSKSSFRFSRNHAIRRGAQAAGLLDWAARPIQSLLHPYLHRTVRAEMMGRSRRRAGDGGTRAACAPHSTASFPFRACLKTPDGAVSAPEVRPGAARGSSASGAFASLTFKNQL